MPRETFDQELQRLEREVLVLGSMDDPGSLILPYPRVLVGGVTLDSILKTWAPGAREATHRNTDLTLFDGASGRSVGVEFTNRAVLDHLAPDKSTAWRRLDLAYLQRRTLWTDLALILRTIVAVTNVGDRASL